MFHVKHLHLSKSFLYVRISIILFNSGCWNSRDADLHLPLQSVTEKEARMPWATEKPGSLGLTGLTDIILILTREIFSLYGLHYYRSMHARCGWNFSDTAHRGLCQSSVQKGSRDALENRNANGTPDSLWLMGLCDIMLIHTCGKNRQVFFARAF